MKKNFIIILILTIVLITFMVGFSSSYTSHRIDHLAYMLALGIDKGEQAKLKVSAQFVNVSSSESGGSSDSSKIILTSCESNSLFSAINVLNSYIGKEINLAHCSVVVFSQEIAKEGISSEIYSLINNEEIRPSTNIVTTTCSAYEYINNTKPNLESLTSKYFDTFDITSKLTGYFSNITIGDFFNNLSETNSDSLSVLGGLNSTARVEKDDDKSSDSSNGKSSSSESDKSSSSSSLQDSKSLASEEIEISPENLVAGKSSVVGERGTENLGLAVFSGDKYCGELTVLESICHSLITNSVDSCIISIDNPISKDEQIEIQLSPNRKSKINSTIKDDVVNINVDLSLNANIITLSSNINYEDTETIDIISFATEEFLKNELTKYFNKTTKTYNVDIDKYYLSVLKYFPYKKDFDNFNWKEKLKNANLNCNIDIDILSSLLVTKT